MKLSEVLVGLREVAPEALAEPWDKVGLHVGGGNRQVKSAMLCIDLTEAVVAEAVLRRCELVVAYHPPIFHPLTRLTDGKEATWKERSLVAAVRQNLSVYSPHTALDAVRGGTNDWLCEGLGQGTAVPIVSNAVGDRGEYKIVTFVPKKHSDSLREAMDRGGAGWIGNYRQCSFNAPGVGTFKPITGANPTIGKVGELERVEELRIEMICSSNKLASSLAALRDAHPYEEPAIDVFKLEREPSIEKGLMEAPGAGRVLEFTRPISAQTLADRVKKHLRLDTVKLGKPGGKTKIRSVAVCVGSGGSLFEKVETAGGADAYVTGEMQHHQVLDLLQRGKIVVLAGHTNTERPYLPVYRDKILQTVAAGVDWRLSRADRAPLMWR